MSRRTRALGMLPANGRRPFLTWSLRADGLIPSPLSCNPGLALLLALLFDVLLDHIIHEAEADEHLVVAANVLEALELVRREAVVLVIDLRDGLALRRHLFPCRI